MCGRREEKRNMYRKEESDPRSTSSGDREGIRNEQAEHRLSKQPLWKRFIQKAGCLSAIRRLSILNPG